MEDILELYHKLLRKVLPTLRQIEEAITDKNLCHTSRLIAARTILYNSDAEYLELITQYYERHLFELDEVNSLEDSSEKLTFKSFDFRGAIFLN